MTGDVGERFLDDAIQPAPRDDWDITSAGVELHLESGLPGEALQQRLERRRETEVVQHRRPHSRGDPSHGVDRGVHHRQQLGGLLAHRRPIALELGDHPAQVEPQGGERMSQLVVNLSRDERQLLFPHFIEPVRELP